MSLSLIVAMAKNRVIGNENQLPWHLPEDLKRFKQLTMGKPMIMGRKTYESIGRVLPGRLNIIVSRNPSYQVEGAHIASSLEEAIEIAKADSNEYFVIGGAGLFEEALPLSKTLYLTLIHEDVSGDTYFPEINLESDFKILEKVDAVSSGKSALKYTFYTALKH